MIGLNKFSEVEVGMEFWEKMVGSLLFGSCIVGAIAAGTLEILAARAALLAVTLSVPVVGWVVGIVGTIVSSLWACKNHISLWSREGCSQDIIINLFKCF